MTTGRINQVTAFSLRPRAQARSSRTPHGTGYGTCLARPNGTALVTARGLDFALLRTEHHTPVSNPFTQASSSAWSASWSMSRRAHSTHTHSATASTSSSLGSLADPGGSRTGCIQHFSERHREITRATPPQTCLLYTSDAADE